MNIDPDWLRENYWDAERILAECQEKPLVVPDDPVATLGEAKFLPGAWTVSIDNWMPMSDNGRAKGLRYWIRGKKRDKKILRDFLDLAGVPLAQGRRKVALVVVKRRGPLPDPSNLLKSYLDAIKFTGRIIDDRNEWCLPTIPEVSVDKSLPVKVRSTVILEDV